MKLVLLLRSPRWRRRGMWMTNGCWTTPVSNLWVRLNPEPSLVHNHKEVLDRTMCVTTADFKGILNKIVKSWEQSIVQLLQGHEDLEMTGEIGLVNHQEIEMVIPKWWMRWRWLVHSPIAWKASHKCLEALTPVPTPIRKSPKHKWRVGEKGYSCISITTCPCINTSYALWLYLVVWLLIVWVEICLFVFAYFHSYFFNVAFDQSFPSYVSKIQKPNKK